MGLIKRFLDFISSKNETNPEIATGATEKKILLDYEEVKRLYTMIKDYCTFTDIEGISIDWPDCRSHKGIAYFSSRPVGHALELTDGHYITDLKKFEVSFEMKVDSSTDNNLLRSEVESAKKQLEAEDLNLIWDKRYFTPKLEMEDGSVMYERYDRITIKYKSFIEPKLIWKK